MAIRPPLWGSHGKSIGCWLSTWTGKSEFWVLPFPTGAPQLAFSLLEGTFPFNWMPDSRRIVFGGVMPGTVGADLHLADLKSKKIVPITKTTEEATLPAASPDGSKIAFTVVRSDFDLIDIPLDGSPFRTLLASSRNESNPAYSATGQLAYSTDRTGTAQIWVKSGADGWERPLITEKDFGRQWVASFTDLSYSPDGQRLAYCVSSSAGHAIYMTNAAGGPPVKLTTDQPDQRSPTWSPDGDWIAFVQNSDGKWSMAKAQSGGAASAVLLKQDFGSESSGIRWSPRGDWIGFAASDGFHLLSPDGKSEKTLDNKGWLAFAWSKDGSQIIGVQETADRPRTLASLNIAAGQSRTIGPLSLPPASDLQGFSLAPDGKQAVAAVSDPRGDIWLLAGFSAKRNPLQRLLGAFGY